MATKRHSESQATLNDGLCSWHANGKRCRYPGSISHNTLGAGPWFCRYHFRCVDPVIGAQIVDESQDFKPETETQEDVDRRVNKIVPRREGESMHDWSMRCRAYVLETVKRMAKRMRLPGEDEREAA